MPPAAPGELTATPVSATSVELAWSAASDDVGVAGYKVFRDGALVATTASTNAIDAGLAPLTAYCWTARAFDAAGNCSPSSPDACATTLAPPDLTAPAVVATTPAPGATGVAPATAFTARFDEELAAATLAGGGFTLRDASSAEVPAAVTWDAPTLTATLTPAAPLENLGSYTAALSTAVADLAGNHLLAEVSWAVRIAVKEPVFLSGAGGSLAGVTSGPPRFAAADFDRDGHVDLAFTCPSGGDVWLTRGDGLGGFAPPDAFLVGLPRSFLTGLAAADLDLDGYADLAVAEGPVDPSGYYLLPGYVDVVLNAGEAGPGTFGSPLRLGAGIYPMDVVAADLDGDGNLDLASVERLSDRLSVFLASGGGAFAPAVPHPATDPVTLIAAALRPGGRLDLVTPGGPVLLGDGSGAFTPGTGAFAPGIYPMDVAAADIDLDGHLDLVVPNDATDHLNLLHGDGTGAFPTVTTVQTGAYPGAAEVADLNGDGWPDILAVLHQNGGVGTNVSVVLLGTGGGELGPPMPLGGQPLLVTDLNGDGKPDLVGMGLDETHGTYRLDVWLNAT
jgi:hypothetical protein